jgi:hypothetical protein
MNKYYDMLNSKYLLSENAYSACVLLKIMNNISVNVYDNKWTLAFTSVGRSPVHCFAVGP